MCKESAELKANSKLIRKLASPFIKAAPHLEDDLLAAANIGYLKAFRHCETDNTYAVSTIATRLIQSECTDLLSSERAVHIPEYRTAETRKLRKAKVRGEKEYAATLTELNITAEEYKVRKAEQITESLNVEIHTYSEDDAPQELIDFLLDERPNPEEVAIAENQSFDIQAFIADTDCLSPAQKECIQLFYNQRGEQRTMEEVAILRQSGSKQSVNAALNAAYAKLLPIAQTRGWK